MIDPDHRPRKHPHSRRCADRSSGRRSLPLRPRSGRLSLPP
ncbi:hypothetical protein TVNIR_3598 [Thioalkalivibrio nitratireducens DSM 14787]|uniref:Uncharacterized protein n=1 Tax=Thioalkalivibrio nitratireducens (strain DSM 14787 / UNIQEM 213 / ALEN2) TaxID=1255043 RepID=L0E1V7_THIND|nr:hypothetical protein TVNIR_3598 [Thioalkalivibrio nitratireducens DSM 14787]